MHERFRRHDLYKHFTTITTSEMAKSMKPHKEIFNFALSAAIANTNECIMIGDNYDVDIMGGSQCRHWHNMGQYGRRYCRKLCNLYGKEFTRNKNDFINLSCKHVIRALHNIALVVCPIGNKNFKSNSIADEYRRYKIQFKQHRYFAFYVFIVAFGCQVRKSSV